MLLPGVLLLLSACDTPCPDQLRDIEAFPMTCRCDTLDGVRSVSGTRRYTAHSPVCKAAAHAGILSAPGTVTAYAHGECPLFTGSGTSTDHNAPGPSFSFSPQPPPCDDPFSVAPLQPRPLPADATCDRPAQVDAICRAVAGEHDIPEDLSAVAGARYDCPCASVWSTNAGARAVLPDPIRPKEAFAAAQHSPLELAVRRGHERQVRFLLENGAAPDGPQHHSRPLQAAVDLAAAPLPRARIVALLVAAGADRTGLDYARCRDGGTEQTTCAALRRWIEAPR